MKLLLVIYAVIFILILFFAINPSTLSSFEALGPVIQPIKDFSAIMRSAAIESGSWISAFFEGKAGLLSIPIPIILLIVNIVAFIAFICHKSFARSKKADAILIPISCCGPYGAMIGMLLFHHMTSIPLYQATVLVMLTLHSLVILHFAV